MSITLGQFVAITLRILAADGIDTYQPTIAVLATRDISVISDLPAQVDPRVALMDTIRRRDLTKADIAFGVRSGPAEVTVGRCEDGVCEFELIVGGTDGLTHRPIGSPTWWSL
ncbi:MAG: hypothetical protein H7236_19730 [Gemmatimonadaceae bacterium]|nr:hypothetical protein [Caulobacter sp.]